MLETIHTRTVLSEAIVYHTKDSWGNILVIDSKQYRNLTFDSMYKQSRMDLNNPHILVSEYTRAMMLVLTFIKPTHVTILGLGGGSLLRSLHHILPDCELHAIELRLRVYEVASQFFGIPKSNKISITISDAKRQLEIMNANSTSVIFADLYHASGINSFQCQSAFLHECHRVLAADGWLVGNFHDISDLFSTYFKDMLRTFDEVLICLEPGGNNIIFASKYPVDEFRNLYTIVSRLEKQLGIKLMHLFKRLVRLNDLVGTCILDREEYDEELWQY